MTEKEFVKMIDGLIGFSDADKRLLISSYKIGFAAGKIAKQEEIWTEELHTYNLSMGKKYDA